MSKAEPRPRKGELAGVLDAVVTWLNAHGIGIFWGYETNDVSLPTFAWDLSREPNWEPFLQLAKQCGVSLVAVDYDLYERGSFDDELIADEDQAKSLFEKLKPHEGEIAGITLKWIRDGAVYSLVIQTDWADDFYELQQSVAERDEENEEDGGTLTNAEVEQHAKTLATDPLFQAAKNKSQRIYAAKKALGDRATEDEWDLDRIIEEARSVYELQIKPEQEAELSENIRRLRAEGLKTSEIAKRLGIASKKVRDLG